MTFTVRCHYCHPTAIVAGPLYCILTRDINPEIPKNLYNPKIFKDDEMPSFGISVFTALVPVILMALRLSQLTMVPLLRHILTFFGQPDIALTIFRCYCYLYLWYRSRQIDGRNYEDRTGCGPGHRHDFTHRRRRCLKQSPHRQRPWHLYRQSVAGSDLAAPLGLVGCCRHPHGLWFGDRMPYSWRHCRTDCCCYRCSSGTDGSGDRCRVPHLQPAE